MTPARQNAKRVARSMMGHLPADAVANLRKIRHELNGLGQIKANVGLLAMRLAEVERRLDLSPAPAPREALDPRFPAGVFSRLCTQAQMEDPSFAAWCKEMDYTPYAHRKTWEFTWIAECLESLGVLRPGAKGLGFGVGREPLVSLFASRGVEILGTDLPSTEREVAGWARSGQHADAVLDMHRPKVIDEDAFRRQVSWRPVDMRDIPDDLGEFDFCWSVCALEHLGTLDEGLRFIEESLRPLKPGGYAIHTTEYNLTSNTHTVESGAAVVYRERDMLALKEHLESKGHEVAAFDFDQGDGLLDQYIDVPPYAHEPVLRFAIGAYNLTSVGIVIRKAAH